MRTYGDLSRRRTGHPSAILELIRLVVATLVAAPPQP